MHRHCCLSEKQSSNSNSKRGLLPAHARKPSVGVCRRCSGLKEGVPAFDFSNFYQIHLHERRSNITCDKMKVCINFLACHSIEEMKSVRNRGIFPLFLFLPINFFEMLPPLLGDDAWCEESTATKTTMPAVCDSKTITNNELALAAGAGLVDGIVRGGVLGDGATTTILLCGFITRIVPSQRSNNVGAQQQHRQSTSAQRQFVAAAEAAARRGRHGVRLAAAPQDEDEGEKSSRRPPAAAEDAPPPLTPTERILANEKLGAAERAVVEAAEARRKVVPDDETRPKSTRSTCPLPFCWRRRLCWPLLPRVPCFLYWVAVVMASTTRF